LTPKQEEGKHVYRATMQKNKGVSIDPTAPFKMY